MSDTIRIGIIGAGKNTQEKHIPGFKAIPGVEIKVVCNRNIGSSRKIAKEFDIPFVANTWDEVIKHPEIDAVCIGTPPHMHAETTIAALNAGKHVLVEARLAANYREAERMLEAAKAHPKLVAQVVPAPYSLELDATIASIIKSGEMGFIREIRCYDFSGSFANAQTAMHWRLDENLSGKNILSLGIIHEMVCRWLPIELEWIMADGMFYTTERRNEETGLYAQVHIPESFSVWGRLAYGGRLTYDISTVATGKRIFSARICGEKMSLRIDLLTKKIYRSFPNEDVTREEEVAIDPATQKGWNVEADFIESIRNKKQVQLTSFSDAQKYMQFTEKAWHSWTHRGERMHFEV